MRTLWLRTAAFLTVAYLGAAALLFFGQRGLLYHPRPAAETEGLVRLATGTAGPTVWTVPGTGKDALIYFGGNAEDITRNAADFRRELPEWTVYLACYRGYCGSAGAPGETALLADALAVHDAIRPLHRRVAAIGRSLGSGIAVHLAAERRLERLALVTPYDSIENVAAARYPMFPVRWLIHDRYDSLQRAPRLHLPVLVLLAQTDAVIPAAHAQQLIAALPAGRAEVRTLPGTGHNTISASPAYWAALRALLKSPPPVDSPPS